MQSLTRHRKHADFSLGQTGLRHWGRRRRLALWGQLLSSEHLPHAQGCTHALCSARQLKGWKL